MSLDQWETFYRGGAIVTGPAGPDGGYDLELRAAWVEFFSTLGPSASLLDIGTGNGAVPLIARQAAQAQGYAWDIHGADLARIDPVRDVADGARRFEGITFHPGVPAEKLPFEDARFDAVTGHYALEYTRTHAALAEIFRVLKPGGDAQFIVHHADSELIRSARQSLAECDLVLQETKLYRRLHKLVTMEQVTPGSTDQATNELRSAIQAVKQAIPQARHAGGGRVLDVALDAAQKLLNARKQLPAAAAGAEVDRAEADMRASAQRLNDLVGHACSEARMDALQAEAAAVGFTLIERLPQYHAGNHLVGWQLLLHRP